MRWIDPDILRDVLRLGLIAAAVAIGEALTWPFVLWVVVLGDVPDPQTWTAAASGWPLLVITVPVMAIWFVGAIQTRRAVRRLGGINAGDRAALAELDRLLGGA